MIYIWLRRTTQWEDERVFFKQLRDDFRPKVEAWNSVFNMSYNIFRHRLKQIAQLNLSRVENALCTTMDKIPNGSIVVPIDDDDWLSPELSKVLETEFEETKMGYFWKRSFLQIPSNLGPRIGGFLLYTLARRKPKIWTCSTNNYALIKNDNTFPMLDNHMTASGFFASEKEKIKRIGGHLSIMNRTLASQTSLGWRKTQVTKRELIRNFHNYKKVYSGIELPELAWCRPYVKMMNELMGELSLK